MGFFIRLITRPLRAEIENFRASMMQIIAVYLFEKYAPEYELETGMPLAVAVTNELFGMPPGNEKANQFLSANKQLVETRLAAIRDEPQICHIVSVVTHTLGNLSVNTGAMTPKWLESAVKLRKLGILLPIDKVRMPSSPEDLVQQGREFQSWVVDQSRLGTGPRSGGEE